MESDKTNFRWYVCLMLFFATMINYLDRQVLSLTWKDFISPEFGWTDAHYGTIAGCFSFVYSVAMFFSGRTIDILGIKRGYAAAIFLWSLGACLHAFCGILTVGIEMGEWTFTFSGAREFIEILRNAGNIMVGISTVSMWLFLIARCVLAVGESGNFPCAIKTVSVYFPKKDRAFATSIFNSGSQIGAMLAPFTIPVIARFFGWEMSFLIIGLLGFIWMGIWIKTYESPERNTRVNKSELKYIQQDNTVEDDISASVDSGSIEKVNIFKYFSDRKTWAIIATRFLPEGVWWFFLFWAPAYVKDIYGYSSDSFMGMILIFVLYMITLLSIIGGYLPTFFVNKGFTPFKSRISSMFIYSLFPLLGIAAPFLGIYSCWFPIIIGIIGAAHQSWSANAYSLVSDLFPKSIVATLTGLSGMLGGLGSFVFNQGSGILFTYSKESNLSLMGFEGIQAGYMIVFLVSSISYILSWSILKILTKNIKK